MAGNSHQNWRARMLYHMARGPCLKLSKSWFTVIPPDAKGFRRSLPIQLPDTPLAVLLTDCSPQNSFKLDH